MVGLPRRARAPIIHEMKYIPSEESESEQLDELASALRHTWRVLARGVVQSEHLEGMQRQGFWVLGALACGPRRMTDLAEATDISSASLTGIVDRLEQRGLVHRDRSDDDRRVVTVGLTARGHSVTRGAHDDMTRRLSEMLAPLDIDERAELLRLLRLMTDQKGS